MLFSNCLVYKPSLRAFILGAVDVCGKYFPVGIVLNLHCVFKKKTNGATHDITVKPVSM
jgi:hypothetical protein